jgi:hypothetical protein
MLAAVIYPSLELSESTPTETDSVNSSPALILLAHCSKRMLENSEDGWSSRFGSEYRR